MRLTRTEIDSVPATTGDLVMSAWREGNASRRAVRIARFWHSGGAVSARRPLLLPLLDPVLTRMTTDEWLLCAIERESVACRRREQGQGCWARSVV